mgnify:FL=1
MVYIADVQKTYATVIGAVLFLVGIIGFFNNPIFGLFGVNAAQNVLHLVGGAAIVWFGSKKGGAKPTNMWLGVISAVVGILGFVPGASALLASVFGINAAISVLHIGIGAVSLGVAYGVKK